MTLPEAFIRIAERSLKASASALSGGVHEKAAFLAYHSFESSAGAYCTSRHVKFHPIPHREKVRLFIRACNRERFARQAAALAAEMTSVRSDSLYPRATPDGSLLLPESVISIAQASRLAGRVSAMVSRVKRAL